VRTLSLVLIILIIQVCKAEFEIKIDAQKDNFYNNLTGPENGYLILSPDDFLPLSGPRPSDDRDLSGSIWMSWDSVYFYIYAEIYDDLIRVNHRARPNNDCIELKFDPDPKQKALLGVVNARLTALDSIDAENIDGVDNLYSEGNLDSTQISTADYARRLTPEGYVVEMRLKWEWIKTKDKHIKVGEGEIFGIGINLHDNDSDRRNGSLNWSAGRSDEMWINPLLLGTAVMGADHRIKLIVYNAIDPNVRPGTTHLSMPLLNIRPYNLIIPENWLYHADDDTTWAEPELDDSDWEIVRPRLSKDQMPFSGWNGIGWFRVHLMVDSSLQGIPLALETYQGGALEIYIDGHRTFRFGRVSSSDSSEEPFWQRNPRSISFRKSGLHILAIRYSNMKYQEFHRFKQGAGFNLIIHRDLASQIDNRVKEVRILSIYQIIFFIIPLILGFIHIFLFAFYPKAREHLYFSISMFCWSIITFTDFHGPMLENIQDIFWIGKLSATVIPPAVVFGLLMLYQSIYKRIPTIGYVFIALGAMLMIWIQFDILSRILAIALYILVGLAALEIFRLIFVSGAHVWRGRWITLAGFVCFMIAIIYQILSNIDVLPEIGDYGITYVYGLLILAISVSIDLSRDFALTSRDLEAKLVEVKSLSEKALEQERRAREEEVTRKLLEADNIRKTRELEEARQLQLSMLPRKIPYLPHLEIATLMKTATEVGGDYYDFHCSSDGILTVAIGDATGHGMKAGTMVTAIKSLFAAFSGNLKMSSFFEQCTEIIKDMNLGNIYMAMMLARINMGSLTVTAAGMPPLFIYRGSTGKVDEIVIKGMPLGAHLGLSYKIKKTHLQPGDTILFMTDGFAELFNDEREILDYPRVKTIFQDHAHEAPQAVIDHLLRAGESWQNGQRQHDDFTFIVIKYRAEEAARTVVS
jgi:serine phosphatase RsbU (regulator of sigma subunit)